MQQRGFTLLETMIVVAVVGLVLGSVFTMSITENLARLELDNAARQLAADIRLMQRMSLNAGTDLSASAYSLHFYPVSPFGYHIQKDTTVIKRCIFPPSVSLANLPKIITFSHTEGSPNGGYTIMLYSAPAKKFKYIILEGAVGRVRVDDLPAGHGS